MTITPSEVDNEMIDLLKKLKAKDSAQSFIYYGAWLSKEGTNRLPLRDKLEDLFNYYKLGFAEWEKQKDDAEEVKKKREAHSTKSILNKQLAKEVLCILELSNVLGSVFVTASAKEFSFPHIKVQIYCEVKSESYAKVRGYGEVKRVEWYSQDPWDTFSSPRGLLRQCNGNSFLFSVERQAKNIQQCNRVR